MDDLRQRVFFFELTTEFRDDGLGQLLLEREDILNLPGETAGPAQFAGGRAAHFAHDASAFVHLSAGDYAAADAVVQANDDSWPSLWVGSISALRLGHRAEADDRLARLVRIHGATAAIQIAVSYAQRGEADQAFEWLARAGAQKDPGLTSFAHSRFLAPLWSDPRWSAFWQGLGWPSFGGMPGGVKRDGRDGGPCLPKASPSA